MDESPRSVPAVGRYHHIVVYLPENNGTALLVNVRDQAKVTYLPANPAQDYEVQISGFNEVEMVSSVSLQYVRSALWPVTGNFFHGN